MSMDPKGWRLLPVTRAAMAVLLMAKCADLARQAVAAAAEPPPATAAAEPAAAKPEPAGSPMAPMAPMAEAKAMPADQAMPGGAVPGGTVPASAMPAAAAAPQEAPVSAGEASLLLDLRHRRGTLDARSAALDQRDAVMAAAEQKLAARVAELAALQTRLETLEAARQQHDAANWTGLVKVYETMKPRDAAAIFDALDMQVLLGVLDRMSERKAAPILAAMQPDRARLATQMLAEMRTRAVTPAGVAMVTMPGAEQAANTPAGSAPATH